VFVVHEWGRLMGLPVNMKAWAMYGRSPLAGPVWVAVDMCATALPEAWLSIIARPIEEWVGAGILDAMTAVIAAEADLGGS
jgi:hypothetical protein